jgi:hypothetical protein
MADIERIEAELHDAPIAYTERYDYATLLLDELLAARKRTGEGGK